MGGLSFRIPLSNQSWVELHVRFLGHGASARRGTRNRVLWQHLPGNDVFFLTINLHDWQMLFHDWQHSLKKKIPICRFRRSAVAFLGTTPTKQAQTTTECCGWIKTPMMRLTATVSPVTVAQTATKKMAERHYFAALSGDGNSSVPENLLKENCYIRFSFFFRVASYLRCMKLVIVQVAKAA